ncbi:hypothetical protein BHE74_00002559 [Ensete ventricosum]|nr:hypothetical protein BHE74_00002559 [Ensete ventricosum]RZR77961.1 hypothetical protein BHM03_00003180 [Ensete ventricosum]
MQDHCPCFISSRVFKTESYRPIWAVCTRPLAEWYADHPLLGGTIDLVPYRTIRGSLCPVTIRNRLIMIDFDCHRLLPGSITLVATREEEVTREKKKERERGRTSMHLDMALPSLDDPDLVGNGKVTARLLRHVLRRRSKTSAASTSSANAADEKPRRRRLLLSSSSQTRRRSKTSAALYRIVCVCVYRLVCLGILLDTPISYRTELWYGRNYEP